MKATGHHTPLLLIEKEEIFSKVEKSSGHIYCSLELLFEHFRAFRLHFVFHLYKLYGEPKIRPGYRYATVLKIEEINPRNFQLM